MLAQADRIREALPPELACHITGAEHRQRELVVFADSAAFRMRIQLELLRLREPLALALGEPVETVSVRVQPPR